jgi:tetratricopeptide (TPR) repeat protein
MSRIRRTTWTVGVVLALALAVVAVGAVFGRTPAPTAATSSGDPGVDRLQQAISQAQQRLRRLPGDWQTWAQLSLAYLEESRITADPSWYAKAQDAAQQSLAVKPDQNPLAQVAQGALANARHDFATAQRMASTVVTADPYNADAYAVLVDAETQLGHTAAATDAVQHLLDLRPGLPAYTRASYDLELRGLTRAATDLMTRALSAALDRSDIAFTRNQLGDLAFNAGDLDTADAQYAAGQKADPSNVALLRGRAREAAARDDLSGALSLYATLTARMPTPGYLIEYAALLRLAGRDSAAQAQLGLAQAAHDLFVANGGVDGLTAATLAEARGDAAGAVAAAQGEWNRRHFADVADALAWALQLAGRSQDALVYSGLARSSGSRSAVYAYHQGMIELALGSRSAARTHLSEALSDNPYFSPVDAPAARRALADLGTP